MNFIFSLSAWVRFIVTLGLALLFQTISCAQLHAQSRAELDLVLQPQLNKAQVISLANLGINQSGSGAPLFNLVIGNQGSEPLNNLYLEVQLRSNRFGEIASFYQRSGYPFNLAAGERVVANNNQIKDGLPGVEELIRFDGGLSSRGEEFMNDLANSTRIPSDIYTVRVQLYQGNNGRSGGEQLASVEQTFGENISTDSSVDLYLLQPGAEVGSNELITSTLPLFRWDGPTNLGYRLIVVADNGQSPETLIQSALSTSSTLQNGSSRAGSLLDYEIVDALTSDVNFTMPPSGVQNLQAGQKYYWQVFTNRQGVGSTESIPSEIWEFQVTSNNEEIASRINQEVQNSLSKILSGERLRQLLQQGYDFNSIVIEGQTYEGAAAVQKLVELSNQIDNGEISIIIE